MSIALYQIASPLHDDALSPISEDSFILEIEKKLGCFFKICENDWSGFGAEARAKAEARTNAGAQTNAESAEPVLDLVYIRTGGTEGKFKELGLKGKIWMLTSGESNSLAASMEILSYLKQHGQDGEILHGSADEIAARIHEICSSNQPSGKTEGQPASETAANHPSPKAPKTDEQGYFVQALPKIDFEGARVGVIGKPSDWLIASDVDYAKAKAKLNLDIVDIPMEVLLKKLEPLQIDMRSFAGSEAIYNALKEIISEYNLKGFTIRCFDLLNTVHNTGCLSVARLNAEGIPASCEGDIPALISMMYLQKERGCPGFMCNLSRINGDRFLFAHCTVPLSMVSSYKYTTHFESGIGTAIKGELEMRDVEIFKIAPDLEQCIRIPGRLICNTSKKNLCRTQIVVAAPGAAEYFLRQSMANHHIVSYL